MKWLKREDRHPGRPGRVHGPGGTGPLRGAVQGYNYGPKGNVEGLLIRDADQVHQVNFPPGFGTTVGQAVEIGQTVEAVVDPEPGAHEHPEGEHPVHRLVALKDGDGRTLAAAGAGHGEAVAVDGIVDRFNYARHGEANGVILDGGVFVHMKPDGMRRVRPKVGQRVTAEGQARTMPSGPRVIEAEVVNGVPLRPGKPSH